MARRHLRVLPPALSFAFVIIAFVFSILTITSKKWAVRNNYDPQNYPNWTTPYYTRYRSPFQICEGVAVATNQNADSTLPPPNVTCTHYKPFGRNATSCELLSTTIWDQARTVGDVRLCQQIHYAGNFGIASTCFIGLGFLATLAILLLSFFRRNHDKDEACSNRRHHPRNMRYVSLSLQVFLFVGFASGIISQFYGILGFIQSAPNQADFASSNGEGSSTETTVNGYHGAWYQGVALSTYATCAWAFAAAAGVMASRIWRVPDWSVAA